MMNVSVADEKRLVKRSQVQYDNHEQGAFARGRAQHEESQCLCRPGAKSQRRSWVAEAVVDS